MPPPTASAPILVDIAFDFRSPRFEDDALALARQSGAPLDDCRQALFLTEGDPALARRVLDQGYGVLSDDNTLH